MSDPNLDQRSSKRLWVIAAVAAVALHLGGVALALANLRGDDGDDGLGAAGAEYAVDVESPVKEEDDALPPGPEASDSAAQQEMTQQKAEVKDTDLPQEQPVESEDPDRIVSPDTNKKQKDEDAKVAKVETNAQEASVAQEAAAPTKLEDAVRESDTTKAPNPGLGKDKAKLTRDWGKKISAYFELHKKYPENKAKAVAVKVNLVLNRLGNVLSVAVAESSGDPAYDDAAIAMIRRSDPVPAPPAHLTDDQFAFSLDVKFTKAKK